MSVALLFPGQGSQHPGMGRELFEQSARARKVFDAADNALGWELSSLIFDPNGEHLADTRYAQVGIFVVSAALLAELDVGAVCAACAAGHSLGQYTAYFAAGALGFETALRLVDTRARLMQQAAEDNQGGMVAVLGLDSDALDQAVKGIPDLVVANYNSQEQQVLSGARSSLATASQAAKAAGAKRLVSLRVSGAFHSPAMQPAAEGLRQVLQSTAFEPAEVPVVSNVSARAITERDELRNDLADQITSPVRWDASVETMRRMGVRRYVELGPGKVLASLVQRLHPEAQAVSVQNPEAIEQLPEEWRARG